MKYYYIPGGEKISKVEYSDGTSEEFTYDLNKNLVCYIDRSGCKNVYEYDALNRVVSFSVNDIVQKCFLYDKVGNIIEYKDGEGNLTKYFYSPKNELVKVINSDGSYAEYSYTATGYLNKSLIYDVTGKLISENSCERNMADQVVLIKDIIGNCEHYKYDGKGQLFEKIDKDGYSTRYYYSRLGTVTNISYEDGRETAFSYNEFGHLEKIKDWIGVTEITNDSVGRALSIKYPNGKQVSYEYNSAGKRTKIQYSNHSAVMYKYDALQRLIAIEDQEDTYKYFYDNGALSKKCLPNGVETIYKYDKAGLIASITSRDSKGVLDEIQISYDGYGRKKSIKQVGVSPSFFKAICLE